MKKFLLLFVIMTTIALVSCKGGNEQSTTNGEAEQVAVTDSISVEDFQKQLDKLVAEGDTAKIQQLVSQSQTTYQKIAATDKTAADAFATKIKEIVTGNAKLATIIPNIGSLVAKVTAIPEEAANALEAAGEDIQDTAVNAVNREVNETKNQTVEKAAQAIENAKQQSVEKANEAVDNAKKSAAEAVQKGANAASNAINKALSK